MSSTAASSSAAAGSGDAAAPRRNSKRPKYSRFTQQELPACKPILTPQWVLSGTGNGTVTGTGAFGVLHDFELCQMVISTFLLVSFIFIPIGVVSLLASRDVVEIVDRYETACVPQNVSSTKEGRISYIQGPGDKTCNRNITVHKRMKQPIYVYYQLDNFYQNHRRYVKSRSDSQLSDRSQENERSACDPEDQHNNVTIVPCGLIAWSLFNDTYSFSRNNQPLSVNKRGISWKSDRESKFGDDVYPKNFQNGTLIGGASLNSSIPLSQQEDLIVWMRTAALPTFRKLYGKIEVDLEANEVIQITLQNNYNTYSFSGKKKLVLSTTSWLGGKNDFIGIAYLTIGGLCFTLAMAFTVVYLVKPRKLGDPTYLSWNRNPAGH